MFRKAMTLAETMIVILIIGILSTLLVRTYIQMSQLSFRVEQEKSVTQEVLYLSQVLQNYSDRNQLDFQKYEEEFGQDYLKENQGLVDKLYLSGADGQVEIYSQGVNCIDPGVDLKTLDEECETYEKCRVELKTSNGQKIQLTNPQNAKMTKIYFKIIPYADSDSYFESDNLCETNHLSCINQAGFRLLGKAYSINYSNLRASRISMPLQQFFNLQ